MNTEIWQVQIDGQVYEADAPTFQEWAASGRILPTDQVRKGTMSWTPAQNVPMLRRIFSGEAPGSPAPPPAVTSSNPSGFAGTTGGLGASGTNPAWASPAATSGFQSPVTSSGFQQPPYHQAGSYQQPAYGVPQTGPTAFCRTHPGVGPEYQCRTCGTLACRECVKKVGTVALCQQCGELCAPYAAVQKDSAAHAIRTAPFGMDDFLRALKYPLKEPVVFIVIAVVYAIGRGLPYFSALVSLVLFAYVSMIIRKVSDGRFEESVVPDFEDLGAVGALGLGILLVCYAPALIFAVAGLYGESAAAEGSLATMAAWPFNLVSPLGWMAVVWAVVYYPMALLVAGYSQNFVAVINPLVGIDTIRRMGMMYATLLFMYFTLVVLQVTWQVVATMALGEFSQWPVIGGAPGAFIEFYLNFVLAYLLGVAIFKKADELGVA